MEWQFICLDEVQPEKSTRIRNVYVCENGTPKEDHHCEEHGKNSCHTCNRYFTFDDDSNCPWDPEYTPRKHNGEFSDKWLETYGFLYDIEYVFTCQDLLNWQIAKGG